MGESMFRSVLAAAAAMASQATASAQEINYIDRLDAVRLETGAIHLGLFLNGERDGFFHLGWQLDGDELHVFDRSMLASMEIYETMDVRLAARDLSPRSVDIRFHSGLNIFDFDVDFQDGSVSNTITATRPRGQNSVQPLTAALPDGTLARVTAFVIPATMEMTVGESLSLTWYAPLTHAVSEVTLTAIETVDVETPAGTYTTTRIELRGGSPENDIFVDQDSGEVVRIDVLGQDMRFLRLADD